MSYWQAMNLPIRVFWLMNRCIPRLQAEKDLRALSVAVASQSGDGMEEQRKHLLVEMEGKEKTDEDESQAISEERDEKGFSDLRMMQF